MTEAALVLLIVMTVLSAGTGLIGILPALFAPMMLAAPGSHRNPATLALFFSVITFPLACLVAIVSSWWLYAVQDLSAACWASLLPFANGILALAAWFCLKVFYHGSFKG